MWLRHYSPPPPFLTLSYTFQFSLSDSDFFKFRLAVWILISRNESKINRREMESVSCEDAIGTNEKLCVACKTSKTPLWRSGPAGPKSLCNACGIRYRKKRSPIASDKQIEKQVPSSPSPRSSFCSTSVAAYADEDVGMMMKRLRIKLVAVGKEVALLQRRRSRKMKRVKGESIEKEYKKLGEVEQAAFVLMSLSCGGSVIG